MASTSANAPRPILKPVSRVPSALSLGHVIARDAEHVCKISADDNLAVPLHRCGIHRHCGAGEIKIKRVKITRRSVKIEREQIRDEYTRVWSRGVYAATTNADRQR